jgi:hypothetical protein
MNKTPITLALLLVLSTGVLWVSARNASPVETPAQGFLMGEPEGMPVWLSEFASVRFQPLVFPQQAVQIGVECVAVPQCPDCTRGGNVCRSAREFYGGLIGAAVAKKNIIAKCQKANALDYCGGSNGCMKLSMQDQKRHRERNGGGCYPQCERVARCVVQYRNP